MVLFFYFLLFISPAIYFYPYIFRIGKFQRKTDRTVVPLDPLDDMLLFLLYLPIRVILLVLLYLTINQLAFLHFSPLIAPFTIFTLDIIFWIAIQSMKILPKDSPYKKMVYFQFLELVFITPTAMLVEILGFFIRNRV